MIKNDYHFKMSTDNYVMKSSITSLLPVVENNTLGIRNFKVSSLGLLVRTMGQTQKFTITFDQLRSVDIIHLSGTNLIVGSSLHIVGYKNSTVVYDSGVVDFIDPKPLRDYGENFGPTPLGGYTEHFLSNTDHTTILDTPIIMTSVTIELTTKHFNYIDVSKILISSLFSPISNNISYGISMTYQNSNSIQRTLSGNAFVSTKFTVRVINLSLERYTEEDRIALADIFFRLVGQPVFITCFPTSDYSIRLEYSGLYIMTGSPSISHPVYGRFDSGNITFEEL